jgi:outer membrane protein assembly factor BamB
MILMARYWVVAILAGVGFSADWPQFRGPNGSGVSVSGRLPSEFGPDKNVVWKVGVPLGYSSPVISGNLIFLTGIEGGKITAVEGEKDKFVHRGGKLYTFAVDRFTGKTAWKNEVPRDRLSQLQTNNSPATPSAATDGANVYVYLEDFGLVSYTRNGRERWRLPLGPFNNMNGAGSSPIVFRDLVYLVCDQDSVGSYVLAVDKNTGKQRWKTFRPEATRSYITPAIFQPEHGEPELILPGPYHVTGYYAATGERAWFVQGFCWHPKTVPVIDGDIIYVAAAENGGDAEKRPKLPEFSELLSGHDANRDGKLTVAEFAGDDKMQAMLPRLDLDLDGFLDEREWNFYCSRTASRNSVMAIRHGGRGDVTSTNILWTMPKFVPRCTSPLLYEGVLYLVKEGGILTTLDPKTGKILKQGRLNGALDDYYASPVGAGGKVLLLSQQGKATVIKAGASWETLAVNDLDDIVYATPGIVDDNLYIRTRSMLYCFADKTAH